MGDGFGRLGAWLLIGLLWLLHPLPKRVLDALGRGIGALLWHLGRGRRRVALRNLELCLPQAAVAERRRIAREHFALLGASVMERSVLWFASPARVRGLIHVSGDPDLAERSGGPVMWLLPHFIGLDWAAPALILCQRRAAVSMYSTQSNAVIDAQVRRGRLRFDPARSAVVSRHEGIRDVLRLMKQGYGYVNPSDMDFGPRNSAFVPFFGHQACTLLAPSRLARSAGAVVQPLVVTMLPRGQGVQVHFADPLPGYPSADPQADAAAYNRWLEIQILANPAQYYWVHKRFKTRPPGEPGLY